MLGELGHFALNLALWVALIQSIIPLTRSVLSMITWHT